MRKGAFCAMLLTMTLLGLSALPASAANHPPPDVRYVLTPSASSVAVGGVALGQFSPYSECTRAQCVAFLWRAAGRPEPSSGLGAFSDVPSGAYYEKAVAWAVEQGVTLGTAKHQFSPDKPVSRAQAVTFLYRAGKANEQGMQTEFNDVPNDAYYAQAVLWALNNRITDGVAKRTFAPGAICDRAQIVTFLYRCYSGTESAV